MTRPLLSAYFASDEDVNARALLAIRADNPIQIHHPDQPRHHPALIMTIRITRNAAGNCITFIGSSMPAYFNACLSGQVDPDNDQLVSVVNDIQTANDPSGEFRYEFYQIPYTDFADKDGNLFANAQEAADYITAEGNVLGVADVGTSLNGVTCQLPSGLTTNTSVIMDNAQLGVNTIKAVADTDGTIHIHAIGAGVPEDSSEPDDHKHFEGLEANAVQINGVAVPGGINDVVNALNELFTVGPFEAVAIADPYSTMIADVAGIPALYTGDLRALRPSTPQAVTSLPTKRVATTLD